MSCLPPPLLPPPQMLPITEPIPIGDWLSSYKLGDYTHLFEVSGYDRTDFLLSITSDELVEIGVQKPGHKKKIMSAVSSLIHKEHLIATKPVSESPSNLSKPLHDVPINGHPFFSLVVFIYRDSVVCAEEGEALFCNNNIINKQALF